MPKKKIERWSARKRRAAAEARAYFERRSQTVGRPLRRQYVDVSHKARWTLGLFLPGFLVDYPNLFDNLRLLARHPFFRSFRITLFLWACLVIVVSAIYLIYSFTDVLMLFGAVLLVLVGIGLGVEIMSALWRHQTALAALEAGVDKKIVHAHFDIQPTYVTRYTTPTNKREKETPLLSWGDALATTSLSVLGVALFSLLIIIMFDWFGIFGVEFKRELPAALQLFLR